MSWICNLPSLKPSSPPLQNFDDLTVNYLLNSDSNSWNNTLVLAIFTSFDAAAILAMPIYSHSTLDCVFGSLHLMAPTLSNLPTVFVRILSIQTTLPVVVLGGRVFRT